MKHAATLCAFLCALAIACGGGRGGSNDKLPPRLAKTALRVTYEAGPDGRFGTADDVVTGYNRTTFQAGGDSAQDAWFYGPGADGSDTKWFTADDVPGGYWNQPGNTYGWSTRDPGMDGKWFTADDPVTDWEKFGETVDGVAINPMYNAPGPDGRWFTDDDVMYAYNKRFVDEAGSEIQRVTYVGPGEDGKWFTADDVISSDGYWKATYPPGHTSWASWDRQVRYTAPGPDGKWLTADDVVGSYSTHAFADDTVYWTTENSYSNPGADDKWFTADDQLGTQGRAVNTY